MMSRYLKNMTEEYLRNNGFDGLVNSSVQCACRVDEDLMPCGEPGMGCEAGRLKTCDTCTEPDSDSEFCAEVKDENGFGGRWCIVSIADPE